jgi:glucose-1-phosphate cytidylyltransferase
LKAVILAGGRGSRLSEETEIRPKPMVEIGGKPILWHIMHIYSGFGINDFVVCLGYKGYLIKEYFANYYLHSSDVTFDLAANEISVHSNTSEQWRVTLIDTGLNTMTGGRLRRVLDFVDDDFCFTYGDGLANLDVDALIDRHRRSGVIATVTAVKPPGRFGTLHLSGDRVDTFSEKAPSEGGWISGGFFVVSPRVRPYLKGDSSIWEREALEELATQGELGYFQHDGFWHPMDTIRDRDYLQQLWDSGRPPWR